MAKDGERLRKVGAMWAPRKGAKHLGSGEVTVAGMKQKFYVFKNNKKEPGSSWPDYVLLSSAEPERDTYQPRRDEDGVD